MSPLLTSLQPMLQEAVPSSLHTEAAPSDVLGPASGQEARPSRANLGQAKPGHRRWLTMAWWPGLTGRKPKPSQKAMAR